MRGLNALIGGLALQLGQIAEQGLVSGDAPAEAPPATEEEAPAEDAAAEETSGDEPAENDESDAPSEGDEEAKEN